MVGEHRRIISSITDACATHLPPARRFGRLEVVDAACGGLARERTYHASFRFVDQMGRLAKPGIGIIFHQRLVSGRYALLDVDAFRPTPNY